MKIRTFFKCLFAHHLIEMQHDAWADVLRAWDVSYGTEYYKKYFEREITPWQKFWGKTGVVKKENRAGSK